MKLTEFQNDTLKEVMNIGVSKSATQLSTLLSDEIRMEVPEIRFLTIAEAREALFDNDEKAVIYQELAGMLTGRTYLVFQEKDTGFLTQAILGDAFSHTAERPQFYEHEAMMEIGNIVISSFISSLANVLKDRIALSTPVYLQDSLPRILSLGQANDRDVVMIIKTTLHASKRNIPGTLIIVITSELAGTLIDKLSRIFDFAEKGCSS